MHQQNQNNDNREKSRDVNYRKMKGMRKYIPNIALETLIDQVLAELSNFSFCFGLKSEKWNQQKMA